MRKKGVRFATTVSSPTQRKAPTRLTPGGRKDRPRVMRPPRSPSHAQADMCVPPPAGRGIGYAERKELGVGRPNFVGYGIPYSSDDGPRGLPVGVGRGSVDGGVRSARRGERSWVVEEEIGLRSTGEEVADLDAFAALLEEEQEELFERLANLQKEEQSVWEEVASRELASRVDRQQVVAQAMADVRGLGSSGSGLLETLGELDARLRGGRSVKYSIVTPLLAQAQVSGELDALPLSDRIAFLSQRDADLHAALEALVTPQ